MKKILLLSVALLSVLFLTFTSCKKKETTPMSGTTWVATTTDGSTMTLSFDGSGKGATFKSTGALALTINGTYEYDGTLKVGVLSGTYNTQLVGLIFGVDNNTLTLEISDIVGGNDKTEITFTKK